MLLVGVGVPFKDKLVIYAQKNISYFIDVFSQWTVRIRRRIVNDLLLLKIRRAARAHFDYLRIVPASKALEVVITKIELRHLFGTELFMPNDLLVRKQPIQMLDKLEVTTTGLFIRPTEYDPVFEMQLTRPTPLSRLRAFILLTLFFWIVSSWD